MSNSRDDVARLFGYACWIGIAGLLLVIITLIQSAKQQRLEKQNHKIEVTK